MARRSLLGSQKNCHSLTVQQVFLWQDKRCTTSNHSKQSPNSSESPPGAVSHVCQTDWLGPAAAYSKRSGTFWAEETRFRTMNLRHLSRSTPRLLD